MPQERVDGGYRIVYDWLDVDELEQLTLDAAARMAAQNIASARAAAAAALRLVRGSPLAGDDGEWADRERLRIARLVARARVIAAEGALAAGDASEAAALGQSALDDEPYDEVALRIVMRAHVAAQRPAAALTAYALTREMLVESLGVDPCPETEALHTAVLLGTVEPPEGSAADESSLVGRDEELAAERADASGRGRAGAAGATQRRARNRQVGAGRSLGPAGRGARHHGTRRPLPPARAQPPPATPLRRPRTHLRQCGDDSAAHPPHDQLIPVAAMPGQVTGRTNATGERGDTQLFALAPPSSEPATGRAALVLDDHATDLRRRARSPGLLGPTSRRCATSGDRHLTGPRRTAAAGWSSHRQARCSTAAAAPLYRSATTWGDAAIAARRRSTTCRRSRRGRGSRANRGRARHGGGCRPAGTPCARRSSTT
ncbi:MAG: hypothetical protein IPP16_17500 [Acidimicrobiaceae bacterium]|nr:hypothetical protein [Acidimicrobiaceae bacterium]